MSGPAARAAADGGPGAPRGRSARVLVAVALCWLAFVAVHLVLSGRWWPWLLPGLLPPLVFAVVPVGLLAAAAWPGRAEPRRAPGSARRGRPGTGTGPVAARRATALAAAVALALGAGLTGLHPAALWAARPGPAPADALRVLAWNTEAWHLSGDPAGFVRHLAAQRADVYLLQEYQPADQRTTTAITPRDAELLRRELPGYRAVAVGELLTLTRLPVLATRALPATPPSGAPWIEVYRSVKALRVDVRSGDRTLSLYNVHVPVPVELERSPLSPGFYRAVRDRHRARLAQYRALAADLAANPHPVLVAGDLNTTPAMGELRELPGRLRDAAAAGPAAYPASWPAGRPLWRLDWALVTPDVRVHRYHLEPAPGMSDHRAQQLLISLDRSATP